MKRTNISLTEFQYNWLKQRAVDKHSSMAKLIREYVENRLTMPKESPEKKPQVRHSPKDVHPVALLHEVTDKLESSYFNPQRIKIDKKNKN